MKFKWIYLSLLLFLSKFVEAQHYQVSLCAIFQNEAPYLKEWIDFHKKVGVEHFWLYNHFSTDNFQEELKEYIEDGSVEIIPWNLPYKDIGGWNNVQCAAYNDAIERSKNQSKWLVVIDTDEFLFPMLEDNLSKFLKDYEEYGSLGVNWLMFGTSNIYNAPKGKMLEFLTFRAADDFHAHRHVKCIVRPKYVSHFDNPHYPILKEGYIQVNSDKVPFSLHETLYAVTNKIRIHHYWTRDEYFILNFKIPRRKNWPDDEKYLLDYAKRLNVVEDKAIFKYL